MDHSEVHPCDSGRDTASTNHRHLQFIFILRGHQVHHQSNDMFLYRRVHCSSPLRFISRPTPCRTMATVRANLPHEDRTVKEPRQNDIHPVVLSEIEQVNNDIKLFKLSIMNKEKGVKVSQFEFVIFSFHSFLSFLNSNTISTRQGLRKTPPTDQQQKRWTLKGEVTRTLANLSFFFHSKTSFSEGVRKSPVILLRSRGIDLLACSSRTTA